MGRPMRRRVHTNRYLSPAFSKTVGTYMIFKKSDSIALSVNTCG